MKLKLNKIVVLVAITALSTLMSSCFKEEPLNAECDIEKAWVHVSNVDAYFYSPTDSLIEVISTEDKIVFNMRDGADITALAPQFVITDGATITPASGTVHDFSNGPVTYTVTSQDGNWSRKYTVECNRVSHYTTAVWNFDFEHFELDPSNESSYYIWHNTLPDGSLGNDWASANTGYRISMGSARPEDYPTTPLIDGYDGAAVCLRTSDTGPFGRMANKRLAAGNMFLGTFDIRIAMSDHLHATRFGIPFASHPDRFTGYYTYEPGQTVQDFYGNPIQGRTDSASVYAVFYRNHDAAGNEIVLYGDNILSSDQIVAIANMGYVKPTTTWTAWDVKFNYREEVDEELLANYGYSLAIVFSSSADGGDFIGAIGSRLCVDKVRIMCSHKE